MPDMETSLRVEVLRLEEDGSVAITHVVTEVGTTVAEALTDLGWHFDPDHLGMYGERLDERKALEDGDRIEVLRPLLIDPKMSRRERAREQLERARSRERNPSG